MQDGTKPTMNNLVDEVKSAQRAVTLHPQLGRKKANQFSLDRKGRYFIRAVHVHTKRNYATHTTRYVHGKKGYTVCTKEKLRCT